MAYSKKQTAPDGLALLKADLKNKMPGRLYFFYGEEAYLTAKALRRLGLSVVVAGGTPVIH